MKQGHCDFPLTEQGIFQAAEAGKRFVDYTWDGIYCSDLTRAADTLTTFLKSARPSAVQPDIVYTKKLRELNFGVREALPRGTTVKQAKEILAKRANASIHDVIDTAERPEDVFRRQADFLQTLREDFSFIDCDSSKPTKVLCMTHGGFIKSLLRGHCKVQTPDKIKNCAVSIVSMQWNKSDIDKFNLTVDTKNVNVVYEGSSV